MLLSIIVVSYNTESLTLQALRSAEKNVTDSPLLQKQTEFIIVDNNSTDSSIAAIKQFKKESSCPTIIIENSHNLGFAAANNQGITTSKGKYILLLNSDTIVQPNALERLVSAFAQNPDKSSAHGSLHTVELDHLGIVAARLLNSDGSAQAQGGSEPTLLSLFFHMSLLDDLPIIGHWLPSTQHTGHRFSRKSEKRLLTPKDWVGGTALMIKKETIAEIGLLDQKIFMYGEDIEWCIRARAHQWDVAIHNQAFITHLQNQSGSSEQALKGELLGYLYIWSKHKPLWQLPLVRAILLLGIFLRICIFSAIGKTATAKLYYRIFTSIRIDAI